MELLNSIEEFKEKFRIGKKWKRCVEAIENSPNMQSNQYYSIGDSLIYMLTDGNHEILDNFVGHRRYMDIHYYISGTQEVEIADKLSLQQVTNYSDETDYEYFKGQGNLLTLTEGNLLILENNEAYRFLQAESVKKIVFKVTVEDNYFLNK